MPQHSIAACLQSCTGLLSSSALMAAFQLTALGISHTCMNFCGNTRGPCGVYSFLASTDDRIVIINGGTADPKTLANYMFTVGLTTL